MGITLWIHTLEDRNYSTDSDDHSWMHRLSDEFDEICIEAEVTRLSDFFDYTKLERSSSGEFVESFGASDEDEEDDEIESDPGDESDLAFGVDDMSWFDSEDGLRTLGVLLIAVQAGRAGDIGGRETGDLVEELENCMRVLEDTVTRNGRFHLSVVE